MTNFRFHIIEKLIDEVGSEGIDDSILEVPPDPKMGDFAFPCFILSKNLKKSPVAIAEWLAQKFRPDGVITEVKNAGPYLNFFVNKSLFADSVMKDILEKKDAYGKGSDTRNILLEFPSPNTNKPLHLGHIRNMLLGTSIGNILKFNGSKVTNVNLNNDRGIHICKSMLAYKLFGEDAEPDMKSDHFVGKWYVTYNQKVKEQPELEDQAKEMLLKWESGDKEIHALWKKMNSWAFDGFNKTYETFNVTFAKQYFESEIFTKGKDYVSEGLKSGVFTKDENSNVIVDLEEFNLGKKVVLRADGTSVYATQDMALANEKSADFPECDSYVYVVGNEQEHYFRQLFKIFDLMKYPFANRCYHLSYGMVNLPDGRMKSREGTVVDADDLVDEVISLAKAAIELRHKDLGDEETMNRARVIGMGALRFFILKQDPTKDMTYDPNESVSFEGETGPYVQYVHARIAGIKKKYGKELNIDIDHNLLKTPEEIALIKLLDNFPATAKDAADKFKPSAIAHYLIDLCQHFNEFYHRRKVIDEERQELTEARLLLCECVRQVVENGLSLLGIEAPDEM